MFRRSLVIDAFIFFVLFTGNLLWSVRLSKDGQEIFTDRVTGKITIDGELEETAWKQPALTPVLKTILPTAGKDLQIETRIWAAYDKKNLYFAFYCRDPEPGKIKNSISQRDDIFRDDHVGISLDTMGSRQSSCDFFINPNGIQTDSVTSSLKWMDFTADFIWESAGKLTGDGYQVEVRIPLESIRYQVSKGKNKEVKMRVFFFRSIPHLGIKAYWPMMNYWKQMEFNAMATLVYTGLKTGGLKMEILPNFTFNRDSERIEENKWDKSTFTNLGVGIKYGITSSITAEATVNPDFSQVESDAFQVEVNRRYPLFYSEKRPFFLESKEVLEFTIIKESMMLSAVHTRRIVDPGWAAKVSGTSGKLNFAVLAANDRSAGQPWETGTNPHEGKSAFFGIARAKYNIGGDNFIGFLYTGRHLGDQRNDVVGGDLKYRFSKYLKGSFSYLHTATRQEQGDSLEIGSGVNAMLEFYSPKLVTWGIYERYSTDFFMATAFHNRVGISRGACGIGPILPVKIKQLPWLKRIIPFVHYYRLYDLGTKMTDISREFAVNLGFSPIGELNLEYWHENEAWAGRIFDKKYFHSIGFIQLFKWLQLYEDITIGEQIYYHPSDPFKGSAKTINLTFLLEPTTKLKLGLDYWYSDFKEKQTGRKIYSLNIYDLFTTYQFNKYFSLRGIVRYDSLQDKLLTDFLASFTLIPGTVVYLGYGSLYLENQWQNGMWIPGQGDLLKMREGIFFKASYLWRLK
ncbi:MAG: carbohydrate binding family 9 domain-containing protein [Candidatus Aminicenantes bacterium]|nr:MAG: carbohydrate binding family 9 domain-containing protein [Candidatus Aminicenantes bacterium]